MPSCNWPLHSNRKIPEIITSLIWKELRNIEDEFYMYDLFYFQPRPTKGKMRIHCLENVDKSLTFLNEQRVHLENMGAHDIVDGNPRLSLGLIWTIILRFQVNYLC